MWISTKIHFLILFLLVLGCPHQAKGQSGIDADGDGLPDKRLKIFSSLTSGGTSSVLLEFVANVPDGIVSLQFQFGTNGWYQSRTTANLEWEENGLPTVEVIEAVLNLVEDLNISSYVEFAEYFSSIEYLNLGVKLAPNKIIELQLVGEQLSSPFGEFLGVPGDATAAALNVTVVTPSESGFVTVWPCGVSRPESSNLNFIEGDVVPNGVIASIGSSGSVCFYTSSETDLLVDVAGWFEGTAYTSATPTRLVDTRDGTGGTQGRTDANSPLTIAVTNLPILDATGAPTTTPSIIGAVALNITVVSPSASGFITVWPCDVERPLSSNINYVAGQVVPNGVVAPVSADGTVCLYSQAATDVVVDLAGWFQGQLFTGSTPTRLVDTRDGTGGRIGAITNTDELSVPIHNVTLNVGDQDQAIPVTATAAALNITVANPVASGFITVWPCGVARPLSSNLNYTPGSVVANNVIAPISNEGSVCLYSSVPSDVIVDISGWFLDDSTGAFVGTTPTRLVDTRDGTGPAPVQE